MYTIVYHSELNSVVHALDNDNCIVKLVCELFPLSMKANPATGTFMISNCLKIR